MSVGPNANFSYGISPTGVSFFGTSSLDVEGGSYAWSFGDGLTGIGQLPTHFYQTNGYYTVTMTVTGDGGATAFDTQSLSVPSSSPTIASVTDDVAQITGALSNGALTNDDNLTVAVSLPAAPSFTTASVGDTLELYDFTFGTFDNVLSNYVLTDTDIANGYATVQTGFLFDGSYALVARILNVTGVASEASNEFDVTVDGTAPPRPLVDLGPGVADGATASEAGQPPGVVRVSGEPDAAIVVTFTNGANFVTKNLIGAGFSQAVTLTAADLATLTDGTITVSAIQTDAAGNTSSAGTNSFVLDTVAPASAILALGTGVQFGGATAAEAKQASGVVTVTAAAGTTVTVNFVNSLNPDNVVQKTLTADGTAQAVVLDPGDVSYLGDGNITVGAFVKDAAGNSAAPAVTFFTLDTLPPVPGSLLVAFQDQLVDVNEVTHVTFQVSGIPIGGSGKATFTDNAGHSVDVLLPSDSPDNIVNLAGFGRNVSSTLTITDAAGNSVTSAGFPTNIIVDTDSALVLRISEYNSISKPDWQGNPVYTSVTVSDLPSNFAALTGAAIADMDAQGVTGIGSANGALILTVDQYTSLGDLEVSSQARLIDSPTAIEGMSEAEFAGMAGKSISRLQSTSGELTLSVGQYSTLGGVRLLSTDTVTLADTAGNLEALTAPQIKGLAANGIDKLALTAGSTLEFGVDQFSALGAVVVDPAIDFILDGTGANDTFAFSRQSFSAADKLNGGGGTDTLVLYNNYGGPAFNADTITSIEKLKLNGGAAGGSSYNIIENDGNLLAGQILAVTAVGFTASDTLFFDGSAETDGTFSFLGGGAGTSTFTGGSGADTFTLGAGAETVRYTAASQSTSAAYDTIKGFDAALDKFDLLTSVTYDGTVAGMLKRTTFDDNLAAILTPGTFAADHAALVTATSGNLSGGNFLVINDGNAGYQAGQDMVVRLSGPVGGAGAITGDNFV